MIDIKNLKGKVILITHDKTTNTPAQTTLDFAEKVVSWYGGEVVELFSHQYMNIEEELSQGNIVVYECRNMLTTALEELKDLAKIYKGILILDRLGYDENFNLIEICDIVLKTTSSLEVFKDRNNDVVLRSPRGLKLVTQDTFMLEDNDEFKGILTVENYNKWYSLYIIRPDRTIESIYDPLYDGGLTNEPMWTDHLVSPYYFHLTAKHLGLCYDDETFAKVCELFASDILEDWGKLASHLPRVGDTGPNR